MAAKVNHDEYDVTATVVLFAAPVQLLEVLLLVFWGHAEVVLTDHRTFLVWMRLAFSIGATQAPGSR